MAVTFTPPLPPHTKVVPWEPLLSFTTGGHDTTELWSTQSFINSGCIKSSSPTALSLKGKGASGSKYLWCKSVHAVICSSTVSSFSSSASSREENNRFTAYTRALHWYSFAGGNGLGSSPTLDEAYFHLVSTFTELFCSSDKKL